MEADRIVREEEDKAGAPYLFIGGLATVLNNLVAISDGSFKPSQLATIYLVSDG